MSYYKISFNNWRQEAKISGLLDALERGFKKFDIDFFLIGALARDTWMGLNNKKPKRTTADVDFAILLPDAKTFTELKEYLVLEEGFIPYQGNSFVLLWKDGTPVDLLPFGDIADNGTVRVEGTGFTTINVEGFREVYEGGLPEMELETGNHFKFCSLPGIVLLKFIAWEDRPEIRGKDILDISDILQHYFDIDSNNIYENHSELFIDDDAALMDIAATVLGRGMGAILKSNHAVANRVKAIIEVNTLSSYTTKIGAIMAAYFDNAIEENIALLKRILSGIKDEMNK